MTETDILEGTKDWKKDCEKTCIYPKLPVYYI